MDDLIARFDAVMPDFSGLMGAHPRPTDASLKRIITQLGISLPQGLVEFARKSERFSSHFLSLGENYDEPTHILFRNRQWHRRRRKASRLPKHLVIITEGFMEADFDCIDKASPNSDGTDYVIQIWCPLFGRPAKGGAGARHASFATYIESVVDWASIGYGGS